MRVLHYTKIAATLYVCMTDATSGAYKVVQQAQDLSKT